MVNFFRNRAPAGSRPRTRSEAWAADAWMVKADIGDLDDLNRMFDEVEREAGGLDFLVCNAASGYNRPVMEQKPKGWEWTMNINARAALFAAQRAAPLMAPRGGGAIVNISSPGSGVSCRITWSSAPAKPPWKL